MEILLHPHTSAQLAAMAGRPKGAYIFAGPAGIGKVLSANELARRLNCGGDESNLCHSCRLLVAGNHPDLITVQPEGKSSTGIGQIKTLLADLSRKPFTAGVTRVVVIDRADAMTIEAQNALLKMLEEPPAATVIILITEDQQALLPTVQSRAEVVLFRPLTPAVMAEALIKEHHMEPNAAKQLAEAAQGTPGRALTLLGQAQTTDERSPDQLVEELLTAELFERMLLAAKLAQADPALISRFSSTLTSKLSEQLRTAARTNFDEGTSTTARQLAACEQFERYRSANMPLRLALESLVLAL